MRKITLVLLFITLAQTGITQTTFSETEKMVTLCKVWGFLKYYDPQVASGKFDWDNQLVKKIPLIKAAETKNDLNKIYSEWINSLGKVRKCKNCNINIPDSLKYNLNIGWLNDTSVFTTEVISKLNYIKENRATRQYYVKSWLASPSFNKENVYKDSIFPNEELRLVGLFRYWNIINYFYPYKYKIDEDWNNVLEEMIPEFSQASDTIDYHIAMLLLTTKINDSHAFFNTKYSSRYFGKYYPSFKCKIIDDKAIVTDFWNDTLAKENDIRYGDVIIKLNNRDIADVIKERLNYIGASNEPTKLQRLSPVLIKNNADSCMITYERNGLISTKIIKLYPFKRFHYNWHETSNSAVCKEIEGNIGYVNMGALKRKQVDSVMKIMMNKKAIIFDVRNYPNGTMYAIANYLNKEVKPFAKFTKSDLSYPGVFRWEPSYFCGKKKKAFSWLVNYKYPAKDISEYFKGKVVLLFNEETQSHAEFTCMALQTAPNVTCIGSQTAGADGNVSLITFPGGYQTYMTGLGVYYPDGRETQRIGIVPDIEVKPTIDGIKVKKDEVLERAIEYINSGM
jgi:carboxyl-terminal processing protease